jgi:hypothetical protein
MNTVLIIQKRVWEYTLQHIQHPILLDLIEAIREIIKRKKALPFDKRIAPPFEITSQIRTKLFGIFK